ncbi:FecR protein [Shimia sp. SK013]|uniref:FecR domain-containing protein n=1 Tax=Shimia sp. SK013 TaxID=1389006 RepID=UPI0006CE02F5|nr:FecR domain-containing protein [Shimia sp. SK013]KPA23075.1 FecR protein [Shimia sp. SK013]
MFRPATIRNTRAGLLGALCLLLAIGGNSGAFRVSADVDPLNAPYELVPFSGDSTLRDFTAQHLNDPDLWPTILRINDLTSVADLSPGTVLQLPVVQVALADEALAMSLTAIQKATAEGARLFAPLQIGDAISDRDTAVTRRGEGEWRQVVDYAGSSTDHAVEAFEIAVAQRDRAAEALITDIHGRVEGRDPAEAVWSNRALDDVLVEFERVRTLTNSTTQVTFRDLSRLRLNPNSNATIQRMRSDPLTGKEVTKVSLQSGDFYALLNQLSDQDSFEIDVPGIQTTTESDDFWIKKQDDSALFVNYDTAALDIESGSAKVSLGQDEGVVITDAGVTARAEVLERTLLSQPADKSEVFGRAVDLSWQVFPEASGYWFEVARDPGFNRMIMTEWGVKDTGFRVEALTPGVHFWRVAALDKLGLPGKWSETRAFELRIDETPPFLTVLAPQDATLVENGAIEVLGAAEAGAVLTLNGTPVTISKDGSFVVQAPLKVGENQLVLVALDAAGNKSEKRRNVTYVRQEAVRIDLDAGLARQGDFLVSRTPEMTVLAATSAPSGLDALLRDAVGAEVGRTRIGTGGRLAMTVPVGPQVQDYRLEVVSLAGRLVGDLEFSVQLDTQAPEIVLDVPPPRATSEQTLDLTGVFGDAVSLKLDGEELEMFDDFFATQIALAPGRNTFELRAEDAAGNVGVLAIETLLDLEPPEIASAEMLRPNGDAGPIEIVVTATDEGGLRQAAPYLVEVGDAEFEGYLRCDSRAGVCRASLPASQGEMSLIEVIVQDYAGNEAFR